MYIYKQTYYEEYYYNYINKLHLMWCIHVKKKSFTYHFLVINNNFAFMHYV